MKQLAVAGDGGLQTRLGGYRTPYLPLADDPQGDRDLFEILNGRVRLHEKMVPSQGRPLVQLLELELLQHLTEPDRGRAIFGASQVAEKNLPKGRVVRPGVQDLRSPCVFALSEENRMEPSEMLSNFYQGRLKFLSQFF
jgi:hypothetical protein